jgi:glutamyl-tRNA synthetase
VAKTWLREPDQARLLLGEAHAALAALPAWDAAAMEPALREVAERHQVAAGKLFQPLRVALTGLTVSPGIFEVLEMLGREGALRRIDAAVARIEAQTGP